MKRIIPFFLALVMVIGLGLPVRAGAVEYAALTVSDSYVNPLYHGVITESDLTPPRRHTATYAAENFTSSIEEAGALLREGMVQREESVNVYFQTPRKTYDEDAFKAQVREIAEAALCHTGVPTEGDYLRWQYGGWSYKATAELGDADGTEVLLWTIAFQITYYTTQSQEQEMDQAVEELLASLDVSAAPDYLKLRTIYDYICENVTYDHDHLNDSSYTLQYTAYGALQNGTAVCQGYAVLLYRLALELDVDCRLIAGTGNSDAHGWNIAQLKGLYYDLDSTWDAGKTDYRYFLKCEDNFGNHTRNEEYCSAAFNEEYPMSETDYTPTTEDKCKAHHYNSAVTTEATCTTDGVMTYTCPNCGHTYTEVIPATGHSWNEGVVTKEPTEDEPGIRTYTCNACLQTRTEEIPVKEHEHCYTAEVTEPTCTEQGYTTHTCACGDRYVDSYVEPLGHDFGNPTYDPQSKTHTYSCSRCGDTETEGCTFDEGKVITEPTEDAPGVKEFTCSICGGTYTEEIAYVPPETPSVTRIFGKTRYETSFAIADELKDTLEVETFDTIIVANGANFPDALAGSYLAAQKNAPILLTQEMMDADVLAYVKENLSKGGKVYILGGTAAVSQAFEDGLKEAGITSERLSGKTRYDTGLKILEKAGLNGNEILVCTGESFADALSVSAAGRPILLVKGTDIKLTAAQEEYLKTLEGDYTFYIIGGTAAVSADLETALEAYGNVERISGKGRYETSVAVAEKFFKNVKKVALAYAMDYPDGLCGGTLACKLGAPVLLVKPGEESAAAAYVAKNGIKQGVIFGGSGRITDDSVRTVFGLSEDAVIG